MKIFHEILLQEHSPPIVEHATVFRHKLSYVKICNMKKILLLAILFICWNSIFSQSNFRQLEIEPFIRWDNYPKFINAINSISTYNLSLKGTSWGINSTYKISFKNSVYFKAGLGYYRYSFNDIVSTHQSFGVGDRRIIDYPTQLSITLGTDGYWYNTVNLSLGLGKNFELKKNYRIIAGFLVRNYYTISQCYHLPYDNSFIPQPELQIKNNYKTFKSRYFGLGGEFDIGLVKKVGKLYIGPTIIIPVYDLWKQDSIFPTENNSESRNKWLRGIGTSIKILYTFKKNRHAN